MVNALSKAYQLSIIAVISLFISTFAGKKIIVPTDYKNLQDALNEVEMGDTVLTLNGIYKENITMPDGIVLIGKGADKTILRGNGKDAVVKASNNSLLKNFTIKQGGIGILSENTNMCIQNCVIKENAKTGIHCLLSLPHIQNNILIDNHWSGIFCELVAYGNRTAIEHNILANNGNCGIFLSKKSGVLVQNNIFYKNKQMGIYVSKDSRKSRIIYNNFYQNRRSFNKYAIIDATNIAKDPAFPKNPWKNIDLMFGINNVAYDNPLINLGKNKAPIGVVTEKGLKKLFKDSDEDGIPENEDRCPDVAEDFDNHNDYDGCPDFDNDEDGIYDDKDECPDSAEDFDGNMDRDGCPDLDNDKDGILDAIDKCPNTAETINNYKDEDGCPDKNPNE